MTPITAEEIIYRYCEGRLFPDPNYYDGRGNSVRDLNSPLLELIHKGIRAEIGDAAARAFVNMVKDLKNTNAKGFLLELYRLERKGWRYSVPIMKLAVNVPPQSGTPPDGQKPGSPVAIKPEPVKRKTEILNAFMRSGSVFGHDKAITEDFLNAHADEIEKSAFAGSYGGASS